MSTKFEIKDNVICSVYSDDREIMVPEGITSIASNAFKEMSMESIHLPSTLTTIESNAFAFCDFLNEIVIPEGVTAIEEYTFFCCIRLKKVVLPSRLRYIKGCAFFSCESLEEINIPVNIEEIEDHAFSHCESLINLRCDKVNGTIARYAFDDCTRLADENGMTIIAGTLFNYSGPGGDVVIPDGVVSIASEVFRKIYIFNRNNTYLNQKKDYLKSIVLPRTIRSISQEAFAGCIELTDIQLPEGIEEIGAEAFYGCESLKNIVIPEKVKVLESGVFSFCKNLSEVTLPDGLTTIGLKAFKNCKSLSSIFIPEGVEKIEELAFVGCESLRKIEVASSNKIFADIDGVLIDKVQKKILWFPADWKGTAYTVPESIQAIDSFAFCGGVKLKRITIPENVMEIGDEVFPRVVSGNDFRFEEIEVSPSAGSMKIGSDVFDFGSDDTPLTYPKLPITFLREHRSKIRLGLGFCLDSDRYEGDYAEIYRKYVKSHEKTLLKYAKNPLLLSRVKKYYSTICESDSRKGKVNYKKLSNQDKVKTLEEAVLVGNVEKVKLVMEGCKTFEFTARVLGLACLYSSLEMVKILVEGGATFRYEYTPALKRKYGVAYSTKNSTYPIKYSVLIAKTEINVLNQMLSAWTHEFHFGQLPHVGHSENSEYIRADIAEYLLTQPSAEFDSAEALFYSVLWGCTAVAERLLQAGVTINKEQKILLTDPSSHYMRYEVLRSLSELSPSKALYALKTFANCLADDEKRLTISQSVFEVENTSMLDASVLQFLFKETDTRKIIKSRVIELVIEKDDANALEVLVPKGQIEEKVHRENSDNPQAVSSIKKNWSYTKLEDGTLKITSYKGSDSEVTIPSKIGRAAVTVIGEHAFTGSLSARNKNEFRKHITKIVIPEGITEIENYAFDKCDSLITIVLPSGLEKIGSYAFRDCKNLENITIPENAKVEQDIFYGCTALFDEEGCVILDGVLYYYVPPKDRKNTLIVPEDVHKIAEGAFKKDWIHRITNLEEIILPDGLKEIEESAFECLTTLKKIKIPAGVKEIKARAFFSTGLKCIEFSKGLQRIDEQAFGHTGIVEIHIPETVTEISSYAFGGNGNLRDIYIPASVVKFGTSVFGEVDESKRIFGYNSGPRGVYAHTPAGSTAEEYMKQYSSVIVINDYL